MAKTVFINYGVKRFVLFIKYSYIEKTIFKLPRAVTIFTKGIVCSINFNIKYCLVFFGSSQTCQTIYKFNGIHNSRSIICALKNIKAWINFNF